MFDNEFRKSGPIFIILSPGDMLLHYLVKAENPKMLPNFHAECDDKFKKYRTNDFS